MNLIKYTLNNDGSVPDYIIDGGYFPKKNNKNTPYDYDLIGLSESNIGIENFTNKSKFEVYIKSFMPESYEIHGGYYYEHYYVQDEINNLWSKLNE
jgi:hypothetical protein